MKAEYLSEHWNDENGNPSGGVSTGTGITISWQNGPLGRGTERRQPNGAFVETIVDMVIDRLEYYQSGQFACDENAEAIEHLRSAAAVLEARTRERETRGVEGTYNK